MRATNGWLGPGRSGSLGWGVILWCACTTGGGGTSVGDTPSGGGGDGAATAEGGAGDTAQGETAADTALAQDKAGGQDGAHPPDVAAGGTVPDPGTTVGGEWTDVEPNDDPAHAVPVGILAGPIWMGFAQPLTEIASATDVDFYVFKTGDTASLANVYMSICWSTPANLLDLTLWEVQGGKQGAKVGSAATDSTSCETIVGFGEGSALLTANSVYLLEVRPGPGLVLGGADAGLYSA